MLLYLAYFIFLLAALILLPSENVSNKYLKVVFFVIAIYWGLSYIDAPDMPSYQYNYQVVSASGDAMSGITHGEPAFYFLIQLFKKIGADYYLFQLCLFAAELFVIIYSLKHIEDNNEIIIALLCFMGLSIQGVLLGALRQGIAIAAFILSIYFFEYKKWIPLGVCVVISFLFHHSTVFIPFFLLWIFLTQRFLNNKIFLILAFILCNFAYFTDYNLSAFMGDQLSVVFDRFIGSDSMISDYSQYVESGSESNFGVLKIIEMDFCYIITFFVLNGKGFGSRSLAPIMLLYFILNTLVGGIVIHRIVYFIQIPYWITLFNAFYGLLTMLSVDKKVSYLVPFAYMTLFTLFYLNNLSSTAIHEWHLLDLFK